MRTITEREAGGKRVGTSRIRIANNLLANNGGAISLPYPNDRSADVASDDNVFSPGPASVFSINKYQAKFSMDQVSQELARKLAAGHLPALADPKRWAKDPKLTMEQWRLLMEMDRGSALAELQVHCDDRSLPARLSLTLAASAQGVSCKAVEGATADFLGRAMPKDKLLAGPFQRLAPGENTIVLDSSASEAK